MHRRGSVGWMGMEAGPYDEEQVLAGRERRMAGSVRFATNNIVC